MQKALRSSDGKFWGGGGGGGGRGGGGGGGGSGNKENSAPDSTGISNRLNNSLADVSATDKESIQLTKKNVLRPSQAEADLTRVEKKNSSSSRMSASSVHLRPRSLSPLTMASSPLVEVAPAANRSRHIRFALPDSSSDSPSSVMNETLTPPPKEFKRSDYKTLRATRCLSTIVTEKERAVLRDLEAERMMAVAGQLVSSPRPPAGIVRSMCQFYNSQMGLDGSGVVTVNRSNSFGGGGGGKTDIGMVVVVDHGQDSPSSSAASHSSDDASMSCPSSSGKASSVSPGSEPENAGGAGGRSGSGGGGKKSGFGLFRSRSWSLRRKRGAGGGGGGAELKRCSPSYSTKSQDSGFSDTESKGNNNNNNRAGGRNAAAAPTSAVVVSSKSTRSTGTSMREEEDGEDPNLTQMPLGQKTATVATATRRKLVSRHVAHENQLRQHQWLHHQGQHLGQPFLSLGFSSSSSQQEFRGGGGSRSLTLPANLELREDAVASERVASSLGNIASMQEGLRMKARLCEEEENGEGEEGARRRSGSLSSSNLLKAAVEEEEEDKASKQVSRGEIGFPLRLFFNARNVPTSKHLFSVLQVQRMCTRGFLLGEEIRDP